MKKNINVYAAALVILVFLNIIHIINVNNWLLLPISLIAPAIVFIIDLVSKK